MPRRNPQRNDVALVSRFFAMHDSLDMVNALTRLGRAESQDAYQEEYTKVIQLMPLGFRASFFKSIGWPTSWGVCYGLSAAQISQDRYAQDVKDIYSLVNGGDVSDITRDKKLAYWLYFLKVYIMGAYPVMNMEFFPDFRRPSWMTVADKEMLKLTIESIYQQRQAVDTMEDEAETSREEQLRAGAEPTAAEQMAVEMGGEGDMDEDEGPSPITTAISITNNAGVELTYVPVRPAFGVLLQSIAPSELGARRAEDIIMEGDNPEANMSFQRLTTTMNNLFGDQIAWAPSIATPQSTYSTARSAQVVFKCLVGSQVPRAVMVVSKMRCTREDLARCPINDNNFPPRITVDGSPYIFSLNTQINYWTAGGEEERLAPSAYRVAVYECYRNENERSEAMSEAGAFFLRYVGYYDETQDGRSAQDILSEEGDAMAAREVQNRGSGEAYVQNINVFEQIPAMRTYVNALPTTSFKLGLVRSTYFLLAIGYSRERVIDALAYLSEQGYMLRNVYTPSTSEYDTKPHFTAVLEAKTEDDSDTRLEMLPSARIAFATKLSGQDYNVYFSGTSVRASGYYPPSPSRPRQLYDVALPFWSGMETLSREEVLDSERQIREASARVYTEEVVTGSAQPNFASAGSSSASQTADTSTETPRPRLANLPSQAPTFGASMARRLDTLIPRGQYVLIGYQRAASQMLFRSGELEMVRSGAERRVEMSYIFYFAKQGEGSASQYSRIQFYQSEFGPLPAGNYRCNTQEGIDRIFDAMRDTNRLSNVDQLQIKPVPLLIKKKLRKYLKFPAMENRFEPQRSQVLFERLQLGYVLPFNDERRTLLTEWIGEADRASAAQGGEQEAGSGQAQAGTTLQASGLSLLTTAQLKTVSQNWYKFAFGIELEGFDRYNTRKEFTEAMRGHGVNIYATRGYKNATPARGEEPYQNENAFRVEADTSVAGADARGGSSDPEGLYNTMEIVSPILNKSSDYKSGNKDWVELLTKFLDSAEKEGFYIDPSAGLHIHVGYANFNDQQTKNVLINSVLMWPVLQAMVSEAWQGRFYASDPRAITADKLQSVAQASEARTAVRTFMSNLTGGRYSWLNLTNYGGGSRTPTFEYRFQGSNIEKDTFINTIKILQCIWQASLKGIIPIKKGSGKEQDKVVINLLGEQLFTFARNRYAETMLDRVSSGGHSRDSAFTGFKYPVGADEI